MQFPSKAKTLLVSIFAVSAIGCCFGLLERVGDVGSVAAKARYKQSIEAQEMDELPGLGAAGSGGIEVDTLVVESSGEQAKQADAFVDSIGVNVHLGYTGGIYDNYGGAVKPRLQELGIRHIRDGLKPQRLDVAAKLTDLYDTLGVKALLISNPSRHTAAGALDFVKNRLGAQRVAGIEGVNEPNLFIGGTAWAQMTRNFHRQLFSTFRSDPATSSLPFVTPSLAIFDLQTPVMLGDLSDSSDYGNIHNYLSGRSPETGGWGDNGYGSLTWNFNYVVPAVTGTKPIFATETGYHNARNAQSGHKYTPESVEARYLPRLFLYHFNRGVVRSYTYELFDQGTSLSDPEQNYGLLRVDNTPKPAFHALKNLIALLKDPGTGFTPGSLCYTLSGQTANVHHTLLQKRNGTFYLILWTSAERWQPDAGVETEIPNQTVTLNLATPIVSGNTYLPLNGTNALSIHFNPDQITLSVSDSPLVIELRPGPRFSRKRWAMSM